jgi:aquaporin Z
MDPNLWRRLGAELLGTYVLVLGGTGSAVLAAVFLKDGTDTGLGIGFVGVSFAFGLTVLCMAYAFGHISGGHFNPAVTIGMIVGGRFPARDAIAYIATQVVGAILASWTVLAVAMGREGETASSVREAGLAANGYGEHSPGLFDLSSGLIIEIVLTAIFVIVIMGITDRRAPKGFAALSIGLALTLIHLISIPVTNTSVNPARSTGPALLVGDWALSQLWMFWVAPIAGAVIGAVIYNLVAREKGGAPGEDTGVAAADDPDGVEPATTA